VAAHVAAYWIGRVFCLLDNIHRISVLPGGRGPAGRVATAVASRALNGPTERERRDVIEVLSLLNKCRALNQTYLQGL